jgi:hypothetical protein
MAIDRIPGVGPANSDIAAATAAVVPNSAAITAAVPTAAQIATAVAAPSAATIAAAVAAPSSATIATAVAAAVPTIGAINTSVANNAPSPNAWVHLGTVNMLNISSSSISFSAYRKLKIVLRLYSGVNAQNPSIRFNDDSSSVYSTGQHFLGTGSTFSEFTGSINTSSLRLNYSNSGSLAANNVMISTIEIENASLTNSKNFTSDSIFFQSGANFARVRNIGCYYGSSAITSITLFCSSGNLFANSTVNNGAFQVFGMN